MNGRAAAVGLFLLASASVAAAAEARFIGDLEADRDKWDRLLGIPMVIEGRVSAVSRGTMRFEGSRMQVNLPLNVTPKGGQTYRVRGEFRKGTVQPEFSAVAVTLAPTDIEQMRTAQSRLEHDDPTGWLELADRFAKRASFYKDEDLTEEARKIELNGLEVRADIAGQDTKALRAVIKLANERKQTTLAAELSHKAARYDWNDVYRRLETDYRSAEADAALLLDRIKRDLPGASEPMQERREALETAYGRNPLGMYRSADEEQRLLLARLFYATVVDGLYGSQLDETASNADAIAEEIAKRLPDRPDLAAKYREKGLDAAMDAIGSMTESGVLALVERFRKRGETERADKALSDWLDSRLELARQRGPGSLMALAQDYDRLKGDQQTAVELYQEALEIDDRLIAARTALERYGYEEVAGKWRKRTVSPAKPLPPGVKPGELFKGMSEAQLRSSFRTAPNKIVRMATFGEVTEIWVYEDFGQVVTLSRRGKDGDARVTGFEDLD